MATFAEALPGLQAQGYTNVMDALAVYNASQAAPAASSGGDPIQAAWDVYQQSMLTGVSTPVYNATMRAAGFGDASTDAMGTLNNAISAFSSRGLQTGAPTRENILKYGPEIAKQGYGNMSYAPDYDLGGRDPGLAKLGYNNYYDAAMANEGAAYQTLQDQLRALREEYDRLATQPPGGRGGGGVVDGGGTGIVDGGGSAGGGSSGGGTTGGGGGAIDYGQGNSGVFTAGGLGNSGVVYGPDGKPYSSVAAAIAAGVTNYSFTKPVAAQQQPPGLIAGADNLNPLPPAAAGNVNPAAALTNANSQLFSLGPPRVTLPVKY